MEYAVGHHFDICRVHAGKYRQARNQLGIPVGAKSFLRGVQIIKLCPIVSNYLQHIFQGGRKFF